MSSGRPNNQRTWRATRYDDDILEFNSESVVNGAIITFIKSFVDGPGKDTVAEETSEAYALTYDAVIASSAVIMTMTLIMLPISIHLAPLLAGYVHKYFVSTGHIAGSKALKQNRSKNDLLLDEPVTKLRRDNKQMATMLKSMTGIRLNDLKQRPKKRMSVYEQDDKERRILLAAIILLERQIFAADRSVEELKESVEKAKEKNLKWHRELGEYWYQLKECEEKLKLKKKELINMEHMAQKAESDMLQYGYVRGCESPRDEPLTPWVDRKSTERPTILEGSAELPKRSVHVNRITRTATTKEQLRNLTDVLRHSTSLKEALGCAPGETQYRQRSPVLAASQLDLYPTESMALAGDVSKTAPDDFTSQFPTYEPSGCSRRERARSAQVALRRSQDSYTDDTPRKIRKLPGQRCSTTDDFNRKRLLAARAMRQSVKTRSEPVLCRSRGGNIPTENIAEVKSPDKEWKAANDVSDQPEIVRWLKHMCPSVECSGGVQHTSGPCQVAAASVECDRVTSCDGYVTSGESATTPGNNWSVESMAILSSASLLQRLDCTSSASVDNTDVSAATVVGDWALSPRQNTIGTRDVIGPRGDDVVSSFDDVDSPIDDVMTQQYGCSTQNDPVTMTDSCQSNDCCQLREAVNETTEVTVTFSDNDINLAQYDSEQLIALEENRTDYNYQQQQPTTTTTAVYYTPDKSQTNDDYHLHEPVTVVDQVTHPDSTDSDTGLSQDDATDESQTDYRNYLPARATHSASEATTIADEIIHPDEEFHDDCDHVALAALTQDDSHVDSDTCESYAAETLMPSQQEWYLADSPGAAEYEYIDVGQGSTHHGLDPTSGLRRQWRNSQQRQCSKPIRRCPTRGGMASSVPYLIPRPRSRQQTYDKEIKRTTCSRYKCNEFGFKETKEASVEMERSESSWVQPYETEQVKEGSDKGMSPVGMSYMNVEQERRTVCTDIHSVGGNAPRTQSCTDSKHRYCPIKDSANVDKTRPDFSAETRWHRSEPGRSMERKTPDVGRREPLEVKAESRRLPSRVFLPGPKLRRTDTRKTPDVARREPLEVNAESRRLPSCAFLHGPEPRRTDTQRSVQTFRPEAQRGRSSSPEKRASNSIYFDRQKVMSNTDSQRPCSSTEANQGGTRIDIRQDRRNTEAHSRDTPTEKLRDCGINQLRRFHSDEITRRPSSCGLLAVEKCEERANQCRNSRSLSSERRQGSVVCLPRYEPLRRRARSRDEFRLNGREPNCRADDVEKRRSVHFTKLPCQADARQGQERPRVGSINETRRTGPVVADTKRELGVRVPNKDHAHRGLTELKRISVKTEERVVMQFKEKDTTQALTDSGTMTLFTWHSTYCNGSGGADETRGAVGTNGDIRVRVVTDDGQPRNGQQSVGCPTNNLPSGWESGLKERKSGQRKDWPPSSRNIHRVEDGKPAMVRRSRVPTRPSISCEQGTRHIHFSADMRWSGNGAAGRATSSARPTVASPLSRPSRPKRPDRIPLSPFGARRNISPRRELTMSSPERRPAADVTNSGSSTYRKSADKMSINNNSRNVAHQSPSDMTSDDCSVADFKPLLVRRFGVRRTRSEIPVRQKTNRTRSASPCSRSYSVPVRCPSECTRSVRRASRADSLIPTRRTSSDASARDRAVCCGSSPSRSGGGSHVRQRPDIPRVARDNGSGWSNAETTWWRKSGLPVRRSVPRVPGRRGEDVSGPICWDVTDAQRAVDASRHKYTSRTFCVGSDLSRRSLSEVDMTDLFMDSDADTLSVVDYVTAGGATGADRQWTADGATTLRPPRSLLPVFGRDRLLPKRKQVNH
ncbi:hypothetical protein LSAT2_017877 [Lamellibrachia satsuma]|nr:hypothetical protein LSAT2_017877 [Lamellibrachia satsuma]